jgi:putative tryptophan/tyrosine transport system substrate-binding protein
MLRRDFITFIGAASILPRSRSQQPVKMYRIAIMHPSHPVTELNELSRLRYYREFFGELRQLGYVEGRSLVIERFSAEGRVDNYSKLVRNVAVRNPDLVFVAVMSWPLLSKRQRQQSRLLPWPAIRSAMAL